MGAGIWINVRVEGREGVQSFDSSFSWGFQDFLEIHINMKVHRGKSESKTGHVALMKSRWSNFQIIDTGSQCVRDIGWLDK
jgi:hypothetical protein